MSKGRSEALFRLIHSMGKAEKRHFKIHAMRGKGGSDAKFLQLFDVLEGQRELDEGKVLSKCPAIKKGQLSNLKAHLYEQILDSLRSLHRKSDIEMRVRELLDHTTILYNRCLYDQCLKTLAKAREIAQQYDKKLLLYEVVEFEKRLVTSLIRSNIEDRVNALIKEANILLEELKHTETFSNLSLKLYAFYLKIGFIRDHKEFEIANNFLYSSLPAFEEDKLSFDERIYLYSSLVGYFFFIQDFERGYEYAKKWVGLFEEHPVLIAPKVEMYIKAYNNLLMGQSKLSKYDEYIAATEKFEAIPEVEGVPLTQNVRLLLFKYSATHRINKYFMLGRFSEGVGIVPEVAAGLEQYTDELDTHYILIFYYKFACMYFGNDQYREAIHWLNRIVHNRDEDVREDIHCFARILLLISHWELEHSDLLQHTIRSTYRFLRNHGDLKEYHNIILKFLKRPAIQSREAYREAFRDLRDQLLPLTRNPYEKRAFIYFDIISWLESKIEDRPVQEVIREKAEKRIGQEV